MTFDTYYWRGIPMEDPELQRARSELASSSDGGTLTHAFLTLLRSGRTAAIGTALDHYDYAEMSSRFGSENPFAAHGEEVLEKARDLLRQPPSPAGETGAGEDGANHASALGAMLNLAQEGDAPLIATVLENNPGRSSRDAGLKAARTVLRNSTTANRRLVDVLTGMVFDKAIPVDERVSALRALGGSDSPETTSLIIRATEARNLEVRIHAAFILAHRDVGQYRQILERTTAAWPPNPPYPGAEVIDLLRGDEPETDS